MMGLLWLITVGLFALTKADEFTYPYAANQTCLGMAWLAEETGFRFTEGPNAPLHPHRTFISASYLPYIVRLQETLMKGQSIFFKGKIGDNPTAVNFNLLSRTTKVDTSVGAVVLHINIRYYNNEMILSSAKSGGWLKGIRLDIPFAAGQPFTLQIIIKESYYEIYFNGKKTTTFDHRMPYENVDFINVDGQVKLDELRVVGQTFHLPYHTKLLGSHLNLYDTVRIDASTNNGPNADIYDFKVNLLSANNDIAFYFGVGFERKTVIRNSLINDKWGITEDHGGFPFEKGVSFYLEITVEEEHLVISVNGKEFTKYKHRVGNPATDYVSIYIANELENAFNPAVLEVCQAQ